MSEATGRAGVCIFMGCENPATCLGRDAEVEFWRCDEHPWHEYQVPRAQPFECLWHVDQASADEYRASIFYRLHTLTHDHAAGRCCCGKPHRDRRNDAPQVVVVAHRKGDRL